jgi:hypothetical protein
VLRVANTGAGRAFLGRRVSGAKLRVYGDRRAWCTPLPRARARADPQGGRGGARKRGRLSIARPT